MAAKPIIDIERVDHVGVRVKDAQQALDFYGLLGFEVLREVDFDAVIIIRNKHDVELNLVVNASDTHAGANILMDVPDKHAGYTHIALRVSSIVDTIETLKEHGIEITQGPVTFGGSHVSVFVRDPDRNVVELRGRAEDPDAIEGLTFYEP
jgi:lactoylglutathione lyase